MFAQTSSHQFKFDTQISQRLSLETFFQLYSRQDGVKPSYGATLSIRATPQLKLHTAISRWALPLKLVTTGLGSVTPDELSTAASFGLRHQYSEGIEIFANMAQFNLADVHPTPQSFGVTSAVYRSHTLGEELSFLNGSRLSMGVSDPVSMIAGDLTLMAATGHSSNGTVQ